MGVRGIYDNYLVVHVSLIFPDIGEQETQNVPLGAFREKTIPLSYSMTNQ